MLKPSWQNIDYDFKRYREGAFPSVTEFVTQVLYARFSNYKMGLD